MFDAFGIPRLGVKGTTPRVTHVTPSHGSREVQDPQAFGRPYFTVTLTVLEKPAVLPVPE